MKKLLIAILCAVMVFALTFATFGAEMGRETDICGYPGDDPACLDDGGNCSVSLGELGDMISGFLYSLADAVPEVVASVEEALPEIVSDLKDTIDEEAQSAKDALDGLLVQMGITPDGDEYGLDPDGTDAIDEGTMESVQGLADQISGMISGFAAADDVQGMLMGGWTVNTEFTSQLS